MPRSGVPSAADRDRIAPQVRAPCPADSRPGSLRSGVPGEGVDVNLVDTLIYERIENGADESATAALATMFGGHDQR